MSDHGYNHLSCSLVWSPLDCPVDTGPGESGAGERAMGYWGRERGERSMGNGWVKDEEEGVEGNARRWMSCYSS